MNYEAPILEEYDYVIVGLGAGGSVLTELLAQMDPDSSIVVLEYGGHEVMDDINVRTPINHSFLLGAKNYQSPYETDYHAFNFPLTPDPTGFVMQYQRGIGFGGCTNHHSMVAHRGQRVVFDEWAKVANDDRWSFDNCLAIFKKMEYCQLSNVNPQYHGYDGWLGISGQPVEQIQLDFGKACSSMLGMPYVPDFLNPDYIAGHGPFPTMIKNGQRSYAAKDFLKPHPNLRIKTRTLATRILFTDVNGTNENGTNENGTNENGTNENGTNENGTNEKKAVGIEYVTYKKGQNPYQADTKHAKGFDPNRLPRQVVRARREIILCAGTIQTAQLLLLSGIGDKQTCQAYDIEQICDLPVGTNIQDHRDVDVIHEIKDHSYLYDVQDPEKIMEYQQVHQLTNGGGIGGTNRFAYGYFWWVTEESKRQNPLKPDIHAYSWNGPLDVRNKHNEIIVFDRNKWYHSTHFETMFPHTYGTIRLKLTSKNPFEPPIVDERFGKNHRDNMILADAIKQARELWKSPELAKYEPKEIYPGPHVDAYEAQFYSSYGYHINGSARIGQVCNSDLTVKGIQGLRIADASVFPLNVGGNTTIPCYMIGYQCAYAIMGRKVSEYERKQLFFMPNLPVRPIQLGAVILLILLLVFMCYRNKKKLSSYKNLASYKMLGKYLGKK
jgi:choline dehydrogenase